MSTRTVAAPATRSRHRVGFFGLLGSGNLGNDGSLEAALAHFRRRHPGVELVCFCPGPEQVARRYGVAAVPMNSYRADGSAARKVLGKLVDAYRTFRWVGSVDAVVVPGTGALEATLPLRPWGFPYALLLVCAAGRLRGRPVAVVGIGADDTEQPVTRRMLAACARLASYRSYRDQLSKGAVARMGVDTAADDVHPDLAFALPAPAARAAEPATVGVGVMRYHGTSLDRHRATEIHRVYVAKMRRFVAWLVGAGYRVRLVTGDPSDETVAEKLAEDHPDGSVAAVRTSTLGELMRQLATVEVVVASRYHNVLSALRLARPTISLSYAAKNDALMSAMGLAEFCQPIRTFDVDRLIRQFSELLDQREQMVQRMTAVNGVNERRLDEQLTAFSTVLFGTRGRRR